MLEVERADRALGPVEPHREPAELVDPEVLVERLSEHVGLPVPPGRPLGLTERGGHAAREPGRRHRDSPAPRTVRSVRAATLPSRCRTASQESFHPWLDRPRGLARRYSTYPSPSRSPKSSIHASARSACGSSRRQLRLGQAPTGQLAEEHHEQRRGVDRAVVDGPALEGRGVGAFEAGLVHDPAGLLLRPGVDVLPWSSASASRTPRARVGSTGRAISEVHSESRPNRVMNHGAPAATTGRRSPGRVEQPQRGEVGDRPPVGTGEGRMIGVEDGRLLDPGCLLGPGGPIGVWTAGGCSVAERTERSPHPVATEGDVDLPGRGHRAALPVRRRPT